MKRLYILIFLGLTITINSFAEVDTQETTDGFKTGILLYSSGKYQEALDTWMALYNSGYRSAELEYNIGNAYFKLDNVPGSILFFERALLLKPADEDISYNLQIAKTLAVDKFKEIPELFFVTWFNFISLSLSSNMWAVIGLVSFVMFLITFSVYLYSKNYKFKVAGFWAALFMLLVSVFSISFSIKSKNLI